MEGLDGALPRPGPSSQCNDESVVIACAPSITGPDVPMHCLLGDGGKPPRRARERRGCDLAPPSNGGHPNPQFIQSAETSYAIRHPEGGSVRPAGESTRTRVESLRPGVKRVRTGSNSYCTGANPSVPGINSSVRGQNKFVPGQIHSYEGETRFALGKNRIGPRRNHIFLVSFP